MIIDEQFDVSAPRETVVAYLLDVERMSGCVSGLDDVRAKDEDAYEATLRVAVGPIKSVFNGSAELDRSAVPDQLAGRASGRDRQSASRVSVDFTADFIALDPRRTRVSIHADVTLRGRLGQFGTGVVQATATELIRDFATCTESALGGDHLTADAGERGGTRAHQASGLRLLPLLARAAVQIVSRWFVSLWQRLRGHARAEEDRT